MYHQISRGMLFKHVPILGNYIGIRSWRILLPSLVPKYSYMKIVLPVEWTHAYNLRLHKIYPYRPSFLVFCTPLLEETCHVYGLRIHSKAKYPDHLTCYMKPYTYEVLPIDSARDSSYYRSWRTIHTYPHPHQFQTIWSHISLVL